ncbi:uroporphyrinogen decarboxylase family protein [Lachnotalea sp. AF33-28]|uniref:uroporphyrinogen decarboxylase family protein n=1 Tax=Lachnotalea sp. AF33-28 TaxID=2292046 RepID=UPI000E496AF7|nr:uroporphyrinogen decarboxylase family protein [Lachnotalea sp. AF33-28]RHP31227.1 hypothetical protein DWZ56_16785 [Lachnotalea sp. AF33-28]
MTNRERFHAALNGVRTADRLPTVEWAPWWDITQRAWEQQGLPAGLTNLEVNEYWGLDLLQQVCINHKSPKLPAPAHNGAPVVHSAKEYDEMKEKGYLYNKDMLIPTLDYLRTLKERHESGELVIWMTLEGYFWYPRTLMGIEEHLYAFYDEPELMHRMNQDNMEFQQYAVEEFCKILTPDFMTFAEDMSYNQGPMLSKDCYDEFIAPYYVRIVPQLKSHGIKVVVDTDGNLEPMLPWLLESGIEGVLPLERQAGVDVNRIKKQYPQLFVLGGYDKTIMHLGEDAMRQEFERILPAMRVGGYVPGVDHQTPPDVTMEQYKIYLKLQEEYSRKALE